MTIRYPRPAVLSAIPLHHAVIEASAGTGKTFTIEHLVVELLLRRGATLEQVLVLTFTEKATTELRKRIRGMIERILTHRDDARDAEDAWEIDELARTTLERALLAFDTASIHTIHAFFQRVLTSNAFPIGRPLVQEMVDGRTAFGRAFREALRREIAVDPVLRRHLALWLDTSGRSLDELEQLAYACLPHHRKQVRFEPAYRPDDAGGFLSSLRVPPPPDLAAVKADLGSGVNARSLGAIAARLEALHGLLVDARAAANPFPVFAYLGEPADLAKRKGPLHHVLAGFIDEDGAGSAALREWGEVLRSLAPRMIEVESAVVQTLLPAVTRQLDRERSAAGQFDFDDMIRLVWEALEGPGAAALAAVLRARYRFALIDEFQDTDDLQWKIFRKLFFEGTDHACYLVGDPKQAIYSFRGADVNAYLQATREVRARHGQEPVLLDRSYRSTPELIAALNLIFRPDGRFFTDPEIGYTRPVQPGKPGLKLRTASGAHAAPVLVLDVPEDGRKLLMPRLRRMVARAMAADIADMLSSGSPSALTLDGRPIEARGVFVLTRTEKEGRLVGEALREQGVPHAFYKQDGLFQSEEAADVRDLLMAVDDPADRSRRSRAWLTPFFDVSLDELSALTDVPSSHPLVQRLEEWHELARRREHERLFASLAEDSGLVRRLIAGGEERELTNYLHLFEIVLSLAREGLRLPEVVDELSAYIAGARQPRGEDPNVQRLESDRAAVQIMTMHKSKGLEADVVYLFGGFGPRTPKLEPLVYHAGGACCVHVGKDPRALALHEAESRHENQRLMYVALTRARGRVVVPRLPPRFDKGSWAIVNDRVTALLGDGAPCDLFERRTIEDRPPPRATPAAAPGLIRWPGEPAAGADAADVPALRQRARAQIVTSYSRIKRKHGGYVSPLDADALKGEVFAAAPTPEVEPDALPGGVAMGVLLHEVIELVPLDTLAGPPPVETWRQGPEVGRLLRDTVLRHGMDEALIPAIARLVHRTLTANVRVDRATVAGLATLPSTARELEFVFPFPEQAHPSLGARLASALTVERGYVQGVIDLVFALDGRWYFADWKTDILPDYGPAALGAQVARNYELQARLYALATVKMLGIRDAADHAARFGGLLYCFLRGMHAGVPASPGVHFERPTWDDLIAFDAKLRSGEPL